MPPSELYVMFDGMTWPVPGERLAEIEWALRYGNAEEVRLAAASVIAAYRALVTMPEGTRNRRIREMRRAIN